MCPLNFPLLQRSLLSTGILKGDELCGIDYAAAVHP